MGVCGWAKLKCIAPGEKGACHKLGDQIDNAFCSWIRNEKPWAEKRMDHFIEWASAPAGDQTQCDWWAHSKQECRPRGKDDESKAKRRWCEWRNGNCQFKRLNRIFNEMIPQAQADWVDAWKTDAAARRLAYKQLEDTV